MANAARAIIIENGKILVMHRSKQGNEYFTLVGGRVNDDETLEQGLIREVTEETGLVITMARLVFYEHHPAPYNEQYIYLCEVAPHDGAKIQETSEEGQMNKHGFNTHTLRWIPLSAFKHISFRTPPLHAAIIKGIEKGFANDAIRI